MVRIILNGCNGAMGKMLANIIAQDEQAQVVAGIDITQAADTPFPVFESIKACDVEADALIDFTVSKITDMVLDQCAQKGLALVLATTGLSDEQLAHVKGGRKNNSDCTVLQHVSWNQYTRKDRRAYYTCTCRRWI